MKIYIDFSKQAITKTGSQTAYEGDFESIVFELLFFNYNNTNWYPTMSQLAPNGREAGDFSADEAGTEIVEDGITYLKFEFTLGTGWVSIKGISNFFIWNNQFVNGTLTKKCIGKITLQLNESTNGYFVFDPYLNPSVAAFMRELMEGVAHPAGVYTNSQIADLREDIGIVVSSTDGYWYYWDVTTNEYVQGAVYQAPFYTSVNKLNSDLVDDTSSTNKFVTAEQRTQIATNTIAIADRYTKAETNTLLGEKVDYIDFDNSADVTFSNNVYTITGETANKIKSMNCIIKCLSTTFTSYIFVDDFDMLLLPVNIESGQYIYQCMCNINDTNRVLYVPFYVENDVLHAKVFDARYDPDSNSPKDYVLVKSYDLESTGHSIELTLNTTNYQMTAVLKDANGNIISTSNVIDLPIESVVVSGSYDDTTKKVILTLQNGSTIDFSVADLIDGLQTEITAQNKLSSDLVDDTNATNKFVTAAEKAQITTNATAISGIKDGASINSFADVEAAFSAKADLSNSLQSIFAYSVTAQTLGANTGLTVGTAFSTAGYLGIAKDENSDKYQLLRYKSGTTTKIDIPEATGTMALTSDIITSYNNLTDKPNLSIYAKKEDSSQTITAHSTILGSDYYNTTYGDKSITIKNGRYATPNTISIPDKTGTMALTSDIATAVSGKADASTTYTKTEVDTLLSAKSTVVANPTLAGTESDLTGLEVNGVKYAVPSGSGGGGSEVHLYHHCVFVSMSGISFRINIYNSNTTSFVYNTLLSYIREDCYCPDSSSFISASGGFTTNNVTYGIIGVGGGFKQIQCAYIDGNGTRQYTTISSSANVYFTDTVTQIF